MNIGMGRILAGLVGIVLSACSVAPVPVPTATGVGLSAEYFFGGEFKGPAFTQISSKVSFNWGQIAPVLGMRPGNFSIRFRRL